jgi:hypothetical protein
VTAYIDLTKSDNSTVKTAISKIISFKNKECCDGAILVNGAFDYAAGYPANNGSTAGDGAKAGGASGTSAMAWSPDLNAGTGATSSTALDTWFTAAGQDLCVYKLNYKSSGSNGTTTWANAVNNCANGTYADGVGTAGWYLPNLRELLYIYNALGGTDGPGVNFGNLLAPDYIATTAENMQSDGTYWTSTENTPATRAYYFTTSNSSREVIAKGNPIFVRCVRRI